MEFETGSFDNDEERLLYRAEIRFQRHGGSKCAVCGAHVRHVVEVVSARGDGESIFPCLCTRCLVAEESRGPVVLRLKDLAVDSRGSRARHRAA